MPTAGDYRAPKDIAKNQKRAASGDTTTVKEYTKADGTVVPEHERKGGAAREKDSRIQNLINQRGPVGQKTAKSKDPTTVAGYVAMFNKVDTDLWGGGDVSISHQMPDGRRIWLYGDTLSAKNGFMHSTALVQKDGKLTPANGGKQILPNGGADPTDSAREIIYWPDNVKQGPTKNTLIVSAMEMSIGKGGPWDFRKTKEGQSRSSMVKVMPNGSMKFVKWLGYTPTPAKNNPHLTNDFKDEGGSHYTYGTIVHDIKLKNGKYLKTRSQNWTNPFEEHVGPNGFNWHDYRPTFGEATAAERLASKR